MYLYDLFWESSIWVPPGYTWNDLNPEKTKDLKTYPFIFVGIMLFLKFFVFMPFIFHPIGNFFNIRKKRYQRPPENSKLEAIHKEYRSRAPHNIVKQAAVELEWSERQIQRWLRQRSLCNQLTTRDKFDDSAWQLVYYVFYCIFGIAVHYDKPWLYDIGHCWYKFPYHEFDNDLWWYFMISLGFYGSETVTHFFQNKRHDSVQLLIHHLVTVVLLTLAITCNFVRIASLVLLVHECADIPLLLAKICGYCGKQWLMDGLFVVFLLLWIVTRLGIYPLVILKNTMFVAHKQGNAFYPVYYIFNAMLLSIFIMHVIWTYNIIQVIVRKLSTNKISDVRSSGSELSDADNGYPPIDDKKQQ